jgi:hypothetical protein
MRDNLRVAILGGAIMGNWFDGQAAAAFFKWLDGQATAAFKPVDNSYVIRARWPSRLGLPHL